VATVSNRFLLDNLKNPTVVNADVAVVYIVNRHISEILFEVFGPSDGVPIDK